MQKRLEDALLAFESSKSNAKKCMNEKEELIEELKGELVACKNIPVKEGESPSLFFKPPGEAKDRKKQAARRAAAKASADNRLF